MDIIAYDLYQIEECKTFVYETENELLVRVSIGIMKSSQQTFGISQDSII